MIIVSDIHWRLRHLAIDAEIEGQLTRAALGDGVLILCGDVAHHATPAQYGMFVNWLERLREWGVSIVVTPGNHDITRGKWKLKWMHRRGIRRFREIMDIADRDRIAFRDLDAIYQIGNDIFVCLNSTKPFGQFNRISKLQMVWAAAMVPAGRLHLVSHHSLWTKGDDRHVSMAKVERLVHGLLKPLGFSTAINGHNHRFEYSQDRVCGYPITHIQTPAATARKTRGNPGPGYVKWHPGGEARLIVM